MKARLLISFKYILSLLGRHLPTRHLYGLQAALNYMKVGRWMYDHGFEFTTRVHNREQVWAFLIERVRHKQILYLEFGVARGRSMQFWSTHLSNPQSILHGFDSFEGLPESGGPWIKGQFGTGGCIPTIDDERVCLFKGWFDVVLPTYTVPPHDVLIINIDVDLYTSTMCVLRHMYPHIKNGTFIYFDEMNHPDHEQRAFDEFLTESGLQFRAVAADRTLAAVLFECTGPRPDHLSRTSGSVQSVRLCG